MTDTTSSVESGKRTRKMNVRRAYDVENGTVSYFERGADGEDVRGEPDRSYSLDQLPADVIRHAALYGLAGKLDSVAQGLDGQKMFTVRDEMFQELVAGNWSTQGQGARGDLLQALVNAKFAPSLEDAQRVVNDLSDEQRKAVEANPKVAKALAEIKAKRKSATATADDQIKALFG